MDHFLRPFVQDRAGLVFAGVSLVVGLLLVFRADRFFRVFGNPTPMTRFQVLSIRIPAIVVVFGSALLLIATLVAGPR